MDEDGESSCTPIDFKGLSERHPNILKKEYLKVKGDGSVTLRFEDPKVSIALTRARR